MSLFRVLSVLDSTRFLKILKNTPRLRHAPHSSPNLFFYFRIPKKYVNVITLSYTDISKILRYDTSPVKFRCVIQLLSSKNVFYNFIQTNDLLHFLCVKKSTIMVKLRKYKKVLLSQNISE